MEQPQPRRLTAAAETFNPQQQIIAPSERVYTQPCANTSALPLCRRLTTTPTAIFSTIHHEWSHQDRGPLGRGAGVCHGILPEATVICGVSNRFEGPA